MRMHLGIRFSDHTTHPTNRLLSQAAGHASAGPCPPTARPPGMIAPWSATRLARLALVSRSSSHPPCACGSREQHTPRCAPPPHTVCAVRRIGSLRRRPRSLDRARVQGSRFLRHPALSLCLWSVRCPLWLVRSRRQKQTLTLPRISLPRPWSPCLSTFFLASDSGVPLAKEVKPSLARRPERGGSLL